MFYTDLIREVKKKKSKTPIEIRILNLTLKELQWKQTN